MQRFIEAVALVGWLSFKYVHDTAFETKNSEHKKVCLMG